MAKRKKEFVTFNRGIVSPLMGARTDVERRAMSAATMENWIPNTLGPMSLRPGLKHMATAGSGSLAVRLIPFVSAVDDVALIQVSSTEVRFYENDTLLALPGARTNALANASFATDLASWVSADEGGTALSSWLTGGYLSLLGDGTNAAKRTQTGTMAETTGVQFVYVNVNRGPVTLRVGSTAGGDEYVNELVLETGYHYFKFTAAGASAYFQLSNRGTYPALVDSCDFVQGASGAAIAVAHPWTSSTYLQRLRYKQSGDVVFVDCYGVRPQRIERRAVGSWAVVESPDHYGPFRARNVSPTTIAASALSGLVTLAASTPVFRSTHVGGLFRLQSNGQVVSTAISAQNVFTDPILVEGAGATRAIGLVITGTFAATVTLQRSVGAIGSWVDVTTYTVPQSTPITDNLDNQIIYYRLGIKTGGYTSGTATCTLNCSSGSITGIAKVTAVASSTSATAVAIRAFGATAATAKWWEGAWSDYRGWPSACELKDSRLWHVGKDKIAGSVVDDFHNHDDAYVGDAGPIFRSIGSGPLDRLMWLEDAGGALIAGGLGAEYYARASAQDEPMTPTAFTMKPLTTFGSAGVQAVKVDNRVVFVDVSESRVREISLDAPPADLTLLNPELLSVGVDAMAVQRRPDTRIHCVLSNGTVAIHIANKVEDVSAWVKFITDGLVEEVCVLPGTVEDAVYYIVNRSSVRYLEKWALESECVGGQANKQLDSFVFYSGASTATLTGLTHLNGKTVACWADGVYKGTFTASGGSITLPAAVVTAVTGLVYTANFESTKLAQTAGDLTKYKQAYSLGVVLNNTHASGLQYGPDASNLDDLPLIDGDEEANSTDGVWSNYNYVAFEFPGDYSVDSRLYLRAVAPKPCTVLAAILDMDQEN